jgi:biotin carboxylase
MSGLVAIVDPYESGAMLAPEFRERGHPCLMVQSTEEIPADYRAAFNRADYVGIIRSCDELAKTVEQLKSLEVNIVVAGSESGVNTADRLSEALGLLSNGTRLTHARRDKCLMAHAVNRHGLRTPRQFCSNQLEELLEWVGRHGAWPVVIKPPHSMSSEGVYLCGSTAEVERAFESLYGRVNKLGLVNETVLAQEFLGGDEYIVDTVSHNGRHHPVAIWKYTKPTPATGLIGSFETKELLACETEPARRLFAYTAGVLDALGIKYGPGHCELILKDTEPLLLEIGARTHGGEKAHHTCRAAGRPSQIELTVDSYLDAARFSERTARPRGMTRHALMVLLKPRRGGRLRAFKNLSEVKGLRSFHEMKIDARPGQVIPRFFGLVILLHRERDVIEADLRRIRELEEDGFYETE